MGRSNVCLSAEHTLRGADENWNGCAPNWKKRKRWQGNEIQTTRHNTHNNKQQQQQTNNNKRIKICHHYRFCLGHPPAACWFGATLQQHRSSCQNEQPQRPIMPFHHQPSFVSMNSAQQSRSASHSRVSSPVCFVHFATTFVYGHRRCLVPTHSVYPASTTTPQIRGPVP